MRPDKAQVFRDDWFMGAIFNRRRQLGPNEMFMRPLAVAVALPRLTQDHNQRALERYRIAEYLTLTGAVQ